MRPTSLNSLPPTTHTSTRPTITMLFKSILALSLAASAAAQRPMNQSICSYYTGVVFPNNVTAANELTLVTLIVNTAVIGNFTSNPAGLVVPGILNPNGTYNGTAVNLVPYFTGQYNTTSNGGPTGVMKNFLDGGGAAPLMNGSAASNNTSNQYTLLTHLYQYFGVLLGCASPGFPAYAGRVSMYEVHRFMVIEPAEFAYFVTQVGLSAASFGVAAEDVQAVGQALAGAFGFRCTPAVSTIPALNGTRQSICTASTCTLDPNANCTGEDPESRLVPTTLATNGTPAGPPAPSTPPASAAAQLQVGITIATIGLVGGVFALFF